MTTDNERSTRLELRRRREDGFGDVSVDGYEDASGVPVPVQGDDGGPWLKVPPFTSPADLWFENAPVPDLDADPYVASSPIEVADCRLLTVYFQFTGDQAAASQLSLVAEARIGLAGVFIPIGVIDTTPTVVTLPAAPFAAFGPTFISRPAAPAEFRTAALLAGQATSFALVWDVSGFEVFRLSYGELTVGSSSLLTAHFSKSQ